MYKTKEHIERSIKRNSFKHLKEDLLLCIKCNNYLIENMFDNDKDKPYRKCKDTRCKECKKKQYLKRKITNRGNGSIERTLLERWHGLKDRCNKKGWNIVITVEDLINLWNKQNGICALSGIQMTNKIFSGRTFTNVSIDRIDSKKQYTLDNIRLVCMAVNQMKSDLTKEQLLFFCSNIIKYNNI